MKKECQTNDIELNVVISFWWEWYTLFMGIECVLILNTNGQKLKSFDKYA